MASEQILINYANDVTSLVSKIFIANKIKPKNKAYFPFIPKYLGQAFNDLCGAKLLFEKEHTRKANFLDVGCGIGNIMYLAKQLGMNATGIECNKQYKIYQLTNETVYYQDAFTFKKYNNYDIIYMYRPIEDFSLEVKLEQQIQESLKVGAIFICYSVSSFDGYAIQNDKRFKKCLDNNNNNQVYKKIHS
jgi:2-polyprenyl-3-methyl-5-hydroxy-6-metoxy-1,4-benzoquinol methylase